MKQSTRPWWVRMVVAWVVAGLALAGCASGPAAPREVTLVGVVIDGQRAARPDEVGRVRVQRGGHWIEGRVGMTLQAGDLVETGPDAWAAVRYPSGTEVYLRQNSRGRVGSFTDVLGEVFAKIRGAFAIQTTFVKAGAEGTAYLVRATAGGETTVVVFDGTVNVSSLSGAWAPMRLGAGAMTTAWPQAAGRAAPRPMSAPAEELARTRAWVERMESLVPPARTSGAGVGAALAIAGLVALIAASQSGSSDGDKPPSALPAPAGAQPGSPSARQPAYLRSCRQLVVSWRPVSGANDYLVKLESAPAGDPSAWRGVATLPSQASSVTIGDRVGGAAVYRWSVQARDARGRAGAASPPLHFVCSADVVR